MLDCLNTHMNSLPRPTACCELTLSSNSREQLVRACAEPALEVADGGAVASCRKTDRKKSARTTLNTPSVVNAAARTDAASTTGLVEIGMSTNLIANWRPESRV